MKALAWQDEAGGVRLGWNSPAYITGRHSLDAAYDKNLAVVGGLVDTALK